MVEGFETLAGPVPLSRPYVDQDAGPQHPDPAPPRPRFTPHPRPVSQPLAVTQSQAGPRPRFTPRPAHPVSRPAAAPTTVQGPAGRCERPARSLIGDELRIPIMWCEFGACIERYTSADALGEQDLRGRALAAGWCYDLLGRLACPSCAQHDETFWITRPPVPAPRRRRLPAGRQNCPALGWTAPQKCPTVLLWPRW